jgi:hypothetical protein
MEAQWIADRAALRCLARQHPDWTHEELAACIGRSRSFVKKWLKRFREAPPHDLAVLHSRSCARKTPPPTFHPRIIGRMVEMRESPPENLQRVPGPKALLYSLPRDPDLQALGAPLPRSTRTIWKILRQQGCMLDKPTRHRKPLEPREPLAEVQLDAQGCVHRPSRPVISKQQHVVEVLNCVDALPSILLICSGPSGLSCRNRLRGGRAGSRARMACQPGFPSTAIPGGLEAFQGAISRQPCAASCSAWALSRTCARPSLQIAIAMSNDTIQATTRSACRSIVRRRWKRFER